MAIHRFGSPGFQWFLAVVAISARSDIYRGTFWKKTAKKSEPSYRQ